MPPEALSCGKLSERGDVWTLGMLILLCMSLEFDLEGGEAAPCNLQSMLDTFQIVKGASLMSMANNKTMEQAASENHNESDGDNYSVSTAQRTVKQTMADVEDNGFNLKPAAHSSDEDETKNPEYWVDFYKTSFEHNFINLARGNFTDLGNYSEHFLDFLNECLIMDVS